MNRLPSGHVFADSSEAHLSSALTVLNCPKIGERYSL